MADVTIKAVYATVAEDDGLRFVGFVEEGDTGYALFRQPVEGGPVWFELNDEDLGDEDALLSVTAGPAGLDVALNPAQAARFGWATSVEILAGPGCEGAAEAMAVLRGMLGGVLREA